MDFQSVNTFWFEEIEPAQWWKKDPEFDRMIGERFGDVHARAVAGELSDWRETPCGRLAEIIVIDQFSRNLFRDSPKAFEWDGMAVILAQEAIRSGADERLTTTEKPFMYMPLMHSESRTVHQQAVEVFSQPGLESNLDFELRHKAIIDRFDRYPHRNEVLGRTSTHEEIEFLKTPGSSF